MKVFETQLPGVGRRYRMTFPSGGAFTIVLHNDGTREAFWRDDPEGDSDRLFETTAENARRIGEVFDGTFFEPVGDDLDDALSDARIRWVAVPAASPVAGRTIGEVGVRSETGASVLAVERDGETIPNPDPDTALLAGDVLVVVGTDAAQEAFGALLDPP